MKISAWLASPKTTLMGVLLLAQAVLVAVIALLDGDASTVPDWGQVATAAMAAVALLMARDADKSSQDSGIR